MPQALLARDGNLPVMRPVGRGRQLGRFGQTRESEIDHQQAAIFWRFFSFAPDGFSACTKMGTENRTVDPWEDCRMELRTEKQKMLAGELYLAADPELVAEREELLRELLGSVGKRIEIEPPCYSTCRSREWGSS